MRLAEVAGVVGLEVHDADAVEGGEFGDEGLVPVVPNVHLELKVGVQVMPRGGPEAR